MLGQFGHLFIITAFVTILVCIVAYFKSFYSTSGIEQRSWKKFARVSFILHFGSIVLGFFSLFLIISLHHFEYEYAWKHSSKGLPWYFIISSFWEGQEGSFLLWIFWNSLIGLVLMKTSKNWEMSVMGTFSVIQLFLLSMILGLELPGGLGIGKSPFLLLKEVMDSEIYVINPAFVPRDGNGLNPLLQNIWMVIHPPVIFLGFALSGVPFSLAVSALLQDETPFFVRRTAPWVLVCTAILGLGIIMGAYWAYETLNFGGYWNWDPVENAILVPWLVFLAAIHGMVLYRRKNKGLSLTLITSMGGFLLIVYSTFLTRSGILGNASVHSFTDLGLSVQLLVFLVFFIVAAFVVFIYKNRSLKKEEGDAAVFSIEFWIILAASLLCLSSFQILIPTSIPVFNTILHTLGIEKNYAPPVDQVAFYSKFQVWFAVAFCIAAAFGQVFYWKKIQSLRKLENEVLFPIIIALIVSAACIFLGRTTDIAYIVLITSAIYTIVICLHHVLVIFKTLNRRLTAGILAHAGMAIMLLGFVYSAGHQKLISQNIKINAPESNLPIHNVQQNLLLSRNIPNENNGYTITYLHSNLQLAGTGELIDKDKVLSSMDGALTIVKEPTDVGRQVLHYGDTLQTSAENTFYSLQLSDDDGKSFQMMPRMQKNPTMGFIASPDIKSFLTKDIYTYISNFPDPNKAKWSPPTQKIVSMNQEFLMNGLMTKLEQISIIEKPAGILPAEEDLFLEATVRVSDQYKSYIAKPIFHVDKNRFVQIFPDEIQALGVKVFLSKIDPVNKVYEVSMSTSSRDWITIVCIEFPFVNLVWFGALMVIGGMGLAMYHRIGEAKMGYLGFTVEDQEYMLSELENPEVITRQPQLIYKMNDKN